MTLTFLLVGVVIIQFFGTSILQADQAQRPNIVVIMADDMGYGDLSCFGDPPYTTPRLDQLATEGMKLTDFHSNGPVCSPTRAALLTGRYQQRAGIGGVVYADPKQNRHHGLQLQEVTFAEKLKKAGYHTGIFGKWHLGYERQYNPTYSGFDQFIGYVSGNVCYHSHLDRMGIEDWWKNDELQPEAGYVTHLITQHTKDFIEHHQDKPFCVYVAHECVHSPFQGPNDPPVREVGKVGDIRSAVVKDKSRAYAEMMTEMDNGVGEIIDLLKRLELEQNTLVLFFSDNGAAKLGSNAPWKGYKGSLWEGGHRVPFIAWQPGKIKGGTSSDVTAMTVDIMPTLLDLAQVKTEMKRRLDGVSLLPVLYDNKNLTDRKLFWKYNKSFAVRDGDWKLFVDKKRDQTAEIMLFNLKDDPKEQKDVSKVNSEKVELLLHFYDEWRQDIEATATQQPELASPSDQE